MTMRSYSASASAWSDTSAAVRVCRPSDEKALAARAIDVERMLPAPPRPVYFVYGMCRVSRCKSEAALCGALTVSGLMAGGSRPRVIEMSSLLWVAEVGVLGVRVRSSFEARRILPIPPRPDEYCRDAM